MGVDPDKIVDHFGYAGNVFCGNSKGSTLALVDQSSGQLYCAVFDRNADCGSPRQPLELLQVI